MKYRKLFALLLACTLILSACGGTENKGSGDSNENTNTEETNSQVGTSAEVDFTKTDTDMFTERDVDTSYKYDAVSIELNGSSAVCTSDKVTIDGNTITITQEGTYVFSGTMDDGMIVVKAGAKDKPQLVFDNVNITSSTSAPLYILEADKVFVTLADGSTNTLTNGGTFTAIDENNIDGVVYSKQDLTFNGSGSLTVNSPSGHGIVAKDDLVFTGGNYTITSSGHGLDTNDSLRVKDASLTIASGKDGAHVENNDDAKLGFIYISGGTFDITAEGDGLSAGAYVQIIDGSFTILAGGGYENGSQSSSDNWGNFGGGMGGPGGKRPGGGRRGGSESDTDSQNTKTAYTTTNGNTDTSDVTDSLNSSNNSTDSTSMKGIKAGNSLLINNGKIFIDSADDAIHSNVSVYINGGTYNIASGDDAFHGEEELTITNGTIDITHSYEGLEALNITFSGGSLSIHSTDDGINAAGGIDNSGTSGGRDAMFGGNRNDGMTAPDGDMGNNMAAPDGTNGGMSSNSDGSIVITGGSIFMYAEGDGLDANGCIEITGGTTIVTGPTSGDTAILDYDTTATVNDGTFIGVGSTMMAQTFSNGAQGTIAVQASANGRTQIRIEDTSGNEVISYTPETAYQCVIISTPDIVKGDTYTLYVGEQSGEFTAN